MARRSASLTRARPSKASTSSPMESTPRAAEARRGVGAVWSAGRTVGFAPLENGPERVPRHRHAPCAVVFAREGRHPGRPTTPTRRRRASRTGAQACGRPRPGRERHRQVHSVAGKRNPAPTDGDLIQPRPPATGRDSTSCCGSPGADGGEAVGRRSREPCANGPVLRRTGPVLAAELQDAEPYAAIH